MVSRTMKPLCIESLPSYWRGRLNTRNLLADHADHEANDAQTAGLYAAIMAGLSAGRPLHTIPEYRTVSARVASWVER